MTGNQPVSVSPSHLKLLNDQGSDGVLLGTSCRQCREYFFGQVVFCQSCGSKDLESVELSKQGTLFSYTIVRVPPPGWQGDVPYALGQVELPEGPHVLSEVVGCPLDDIKIGMKLRLALVVGGEDPQSNQVIVYKWRPLE